ncbi:MAG: hypothetical protein IKX99_03085, partial [Lachnospiraceae bacterium]|nr:hypothetical protein [Lachnospiraceae bacterium]
MIKARSRNLQLKIKNAGDAVQLLGCIPLFGFFTFNYTTINHYSFSFSFTFFSPLFLPFPLLLLFLTYNAI